MRSAAARNGNGNSVGAAPYVPSAAAAAGRADFATIASWIPKRARILDLGCGDGSLLA
ncbi:MAG TPA: methionine biosynthesis protein MetW, partial [Casimicrobiaceae bacterium]|nr:methionine biosynthesis protein MetW [Casimicrobiaceae bacterium]